MADQKPKETAPKAIMVKPLPQILDELEDSIKTADEAAKDARAAAEEARRAGDAWERLPDPKPRLALGIFTPGGQEEIFYLGPHAPHLTPGEIDLLHSIWLHYSTELAPAEIHHHDIVHFALLKLQELGAQGRDDEVRQMLERHLEEIKPRRIRPR